MKSRHRILFTVLGGLLVTAGIVAESSTKVVSTSLQGQRLVLNASNEELCKGKAGITSIAYKLSDGTVVEPGLWINVSGTDYQGSGATPRTFAASNVSDIMDNLTTNLKLYDASDNEITYVLGDQSQECHFTYPSNIYLDLKSPSSNENPVNSAVRIEIKKGLKIPAEEYLADMTTKPHKYYEIITDYTATRNAVATDWTLISNPERFDTELIDIQAEGSSTHYVQVRNGSEAGGGGTDALFMLLLLKDNDYTTTAEYQGSTDFTSNVMVHDSSGDYILKQLLRSGNPTFKLWGENYSIGFPIDGNKVNATTINSVEILPNCVFPSMNGEFAYFLAEHEYFNLDKTQVGWSTTFGKATEKCHTVTITDLEEKKSFARGETGKEVVLPKLGSAALGYTTTYLSDEVEIYDGNKFIMPDKDVNVTAKTVPMPYKITYVGLEGCDPIVNPDTYTIEDDDFVLKNPTKPGYRFTGWIGGAYSDPAKEAKITKGSYGDLTFTACFEMMRCVVTFETNGGSMVMPQTVDYNTTVEQPANPTKEGLTFLGWYKDEALTEPFNFSTPITTDLTLYAKFAVTVTVHFDSAGGSSFDDVLVEKGKAIAEPTVVPTKKGYTFDGWYNGNAKWDFNNTVDQDITLTAHWKKNGGGCGGSIVAGTAIGGIAAVGAAVLLVLKKKKKEE